MTDFEQLQAAWEEIGALKNKLRLAEEALRMIGELNTAKSVHRNVDDYGKIARFALEVLK